MKTDLMLIPFKISETHYRLIIVLADHNLSRMKKFDPCCFNLDQLQEFGELELSGILVAYATDADRQKIMQHLVTGAGMKPILEILTRGFEYHPELGDSDDPPTVIRPPGRG